MSAWSKSRWGFVAASVLLPAAALASEPERDDDRIGAMILGGVGYGTQDDSDAGSFGPAFGLKLGWVPVWRLYTGAEGTFHLGTRFDDEQNRVQLYGLEVGIRIGSETLSFVPYLAGGLAIVESQRNVEPTLLRAYAALGGQATFIPVVPLVVGADVRLSHVPLGSEQADNAGPIGTFDALGLVGLLF